MKSSISDANIRNLADGEGPVYHFDLSKIPAEFYEPLFRSLQIFAINNIESLGFSCDELKRAEQKVVIGRPFPVTVLNSIAKRKSTYIRNIVQLIAYILPRNSKLREIYLSNILFTREQISRLISSFSYSTSLESIILCNINIGDEGLRSLLSALDPNQITSITIKYCGVTNDSLKDILKFIQEKDPEQSKNGGIRSFTISRTEISPEGQKKIKAALGNASSSKSVISFPRNSKSKEYDNEELDELNELEKENAKLTEELERLKKSLNAVQYKSDVFIVGKEAQQFVSFLSKIEKKIDEYESKNDLLKRF